MDCRNNFRYIFAKDMQQSCRLQIPINHLQSLLNRTKSEVSQIFENTMINAAFIVSIAMSITFARGISLMFVFQYTNIYIFVGLRLKR